MVIIVLNGVQMECILIPSILPAKIVLSIAKCVYLKLNAHNVLMTWFYIWAHAYRIAHHIITKMVAKVFV